MSTQPSESLLPAEGAADEADPTPRLVLPGQSPDGLYVLSVLAKRTYDITPDGFCVRAARDRKILPADVHYGDPMNSTVQFESDFIPFKLATDVVLNGVAYAPGGAPVLELPVSIQVDRTRRDLIAIGDRECRFQGEKATPLFTDPAPFVTMELRYERAYGGVDIYSDPKVPVHYLRNPLGRGFAVTLNRRAIDRLPLPNIEDPADRLTPERMTCGHFMYWEQQPMPAGFGWIHRTWQPRAALAGVLPADRAFEQEMRAIYRTLVPREQLEMYDQTGLPDMDFRFFNGASPGLVFPYMRGDEYIQTLHLTPEGLSAFALPGNVLRAGLDIGHGVSEADALLHTVMIRMEERQVDLTWSAPFPYNGPDSLNDLTRLNVFLQ